MFLETTQIIRTKNILSTATEDTPYSAYGALIVHGSTPRKRIALARRLIRGLSEHFHQSQFKRLPMAKRSRFEIDFFACYSGSDDDGDCAHYSFAVANGKSLTKPEFQAVKA